MARLADPVLQYVDNNGPLSGGFINFFITGTSTRKDTFSNAALTIANANPVVLDDAGKATNVFLAEDVAYKMIINRASTTGVAGSQGSQFDEIDGVTGTVVATGAFAAWSPTVTYDIPDVVTGSDSLYYKSITDSNLNNDPTSTPANWSQVTFNTHYNANQTYAVNDNVTDAGIIYTSRVASNLNNTPASSPGQWQPVNLAAMTAASLYF